MEVLRLGSSEFVFFTDIIVYIFNFFVFFFIFKAYNNEMDIAQLDQDPQLPSLAATLADRISEAIATGVYPPGSKLDEVELADRYGVSRTPVREALIQLGAAGFITMRPRRGASVAQISALRLVEMFDVMAELEAFCARLASRRATPEELIQLRNIHYSCEEAVKLNDPEDYYLRNESFHHLLYKLSHNVFLEEQALALSRRLRPYRRLQLRVRARVLSSFSEHGEVVEAICAGSEEQAALAIRSHVTVQGERFADLMSSMIGKTQS